MVNPWHPIDINAAIRKQGLTHEEIARHLNCSRSTVTHTIRTGSSKAVRDYIALVVGCPAEEIWPCRFPPSEKSDPT